MIIPSQLAQVAPTAFASRRGRSDHQPAQVAFIRHRRSQIDHRLLKSVRPAVASAFSTCVVLAAPAIFKLNESLLEIATIIFIN
jgi:hypothetical protein